MQQMNQGRSSFERRIVNSRIREEETKNWSYSETNASVLTSNGRWLFTPVINAGSIKMLMQQLNHQHKFKECEKWRMGQISPVHDTSWLFLSRGTELWGLHQLLQREKCMNNHRHPFGRSPTRGKVSNPVQDSYTVCIPIGVCAGEQFRMTINGRLFILTCPGGAHPGQYIRVILPPPPEDDGLPQPRRHIGNANGQRSDETKLFDVLVPRGIRPGQKFSVIHGGLRVSVICPQNAASGQRVRCRLPIWFQSGTLGN